MLETLSATPTPKFSLNKVILKRGTLLNQENYGNISSLEENNEKIVKFSLVFQTYKDIDEVNKTQGFSKSEQILKYLKFKVINFSDKQVLQEYKNSPSLLLNELQETNVNIFALSDLAPVNKEDNKFLCSAHITKPIGLVNNNYFGILYFCFYDLQAISKDFSLDISDTSGIESYFLGEIQEKDIIVNGLPEKDEKIFNLLKLEEAKDIILMKYNSRPTKSYLSKLFNSYSITAKNVGA